jgi:hypothetical protein
MNKNTYADTYEIEEGEGSPWETLTLRKITIGKDGDLNGDRGNMDKRIRNGSRNREYNETHNLV